MSLTNEDLKAIGRLIEPLKEDMADMKTDIVDMKTDIVDMKADIVDMKSDISGLKTDVVDMKSDISGLKTDVVDMKSDISGLKTDVVDMKSDISGLKTDVVDMKSDISGLKTDVEDIHLKMVTKDFLEVQLHELENNVLSEVDRVQEKSNDHYKELKDEIRKVRIDMGTRDNEDIRLKLEIFGMELEDIRKKVS